MSQFFRLSAGSFINFPILKNPILLPVELMPAPPFFAPFWAKCLKSYVCTISNPHHPISLKTIGSGLCSLIFPKTSLIKVPGNLHCAQCPGKLNSSSRLTHLQGLLWKITPSSLKCFLFLASRTPHSLHSSSVHRPPLQSHLC